MKVNLLHYTGYPDQWRAADLMIFTKNTRLRMGVHGLEAIAGWSLEKKMEELAYMANTIRSSWEFTDYTFIIEDVTRAFTHQLVRTRHGTYAQQTQQVLRIDASAVEPPRGDLNDEAKTLWEDAVENVAVVYDMMLAEGATVEQARGILPTNVKTNIVAKFNLRTLVEIFDQRISPRNLGEYREVAELMKYCVLEVHPWAKVFLDQSRDRYLVALDEMINNYVEPQGPRTDMHKLVDQLRRSREVSDD